MYNIFLYSAFLDIYIYLYIYTCNKLAIFSLFYFSLSALRTVELWICRVRLWCCL